MTDVLLITGPMNASQLGVPADATYKVVQVHPSGSDIGSNAYYKTMAAWLGGMSLRERLQAAVNGSVDKVGVAWFSAGHGAIKAILAGSTAPSDVEAWLCLDGFYGSNKWAIAVTEAAMRNDSSIMASASTSTPGQYEHSLDRWRSVVEANSIPAVSPDAATQWGLPAPDYCWGSGSCLIAGYENLGHHKQVPAVREAMLRWWDAARAYDPTKPDPGKPDSPKDEDTGLSPWGIMAAAAVGALLGWGFDRLVNPRPR